MFKQKVFGFQGRTLPFTLFFGLFLLTISVYESIIGLEGIHAFTYILPGIILAIAAIIIFMLSFISYEYRLMYNCLIIRKIVFGKTRHSVTVSLDDRTVGFANITKSDAAKSLHKMYLPFFKRGERVRMTYNKKNSKRKNLVFQPSAELFEMINNYRKENPTGC